MAIDNTPRWMKASPESEYYFDIDPSVTSAAEAKAFLLRELDPVDIEGTTYALACGTPMPEKFPLDFETIDEEMSSLFYEEYPSEFFPDQMSELYDGMVEVWKKWREKHPEVVGNALHFIEGPFQLTEAEGDDPSYPG